MWLAAVGLALVATGCIEPRITNTGRSAVEQNLISHAVERAVDNMSFTAYAGKNAVLDFGKLAPQCDKDYVTAVIETHLALSGVKVVEKAEEAQIKIRFVCGVLATDNTSLNIGTPAIPVPLPNTNINFGIPELSIFKRVARTGSCRISAVIYDVKTGNVLDAYRGVQSRTFYNYWIAFMIFPYVLRDVDVADTGTIKFEFMGE
ncbi:MAG: hypothetical protein J6Y54_08365 [Lentisphaeria bacterium]|nr:hypothetical protein [Lentisphaeria bacterium]